MAKTWIIVALFLGMSTLFLHAQSSFMDNTTGEMIRFKIPERDQNGVLVWMLEGERAQLRRDGTKEIEGLKVTTYNKSKADWTFLTPHCILLYDQTTRQAVGEKEVHLYNDKVNITGKGFYWLVNEDRFIIRSNATVVIAGGFTKEKML
jgi:hypothetical protein